MSSVSQNLIPVEKKEQISLSQKLTIHEQHHQLYALKWSEFQSSIVNCFQRLRDEEDFVDVTISCDQRSFAAHRVVLSACSPYFRKLLKSNPCKHPIIILRDVYSEHMECLLSFMYNGEVNIRQDQLQDFLKAAHMLQIRGLTDVSDNYCPPEFNLSEKKTLDNSIISSKAYKKDSDKDDCNAEYIEKSSNSSKYKLFSDRPITSALMTSFNNNSINPYLIKETQSAASSLQRENTDPYRNRKTLLTPPPQKRIKSADLFRAQHGINSERALSEAEFPAILQHQISRERRHLFNDCDRAIEANETTIGSSIEEKTAFNFQRTDKQSTQEESADDDSNCSSEYPLDRVGTQQETNDSVDNLRPAMPNTFSGIPKSLEQQGHLNKNEFGSQRSVEMRVRATDPRPCPKCGKIYRSAHTLRTHLEDKHTVCPGYRCVLCGTVAKSRNSLHSHMSRQHRGISTKDLPVLPMPCAFDPILASRLLAKAGVKISPDDLRDHASPANTTNIRGIDYSYNTQHNTETYETNIESDDDPEDLTACRLNLNSSSAGYNNKQENVLDIGHKNRSISHIRNDAAIVAAAAALNAQKELPSGQSTTNQPLLDLHLLQFLTENTFGMGISQEHTTAATLHAAKIVQLNALGHKFDSLSPALTQSHCDLPKESIANDSFDSKRSETAIFSTEPILRQHLASDTSLNDNVTTFSSLVTKESHSSDFAKNLNENQPTEDAHNLKEKKYYDADNNEHEARNNFNEKELL
ncbi:protein abrupt-like isoform X2 [Bactrocera tryoni]|uniref:protein abrupt-like isoform X2 n=1 Tax=Bactrocera tryoni TaxID=59916 RepID=UPI001A974085|nr:protein abrupt-like isoform X2 [Bactrocera tryoni]